MTYTVATMAVSENTYLEILGKLREAGYDHAIDDQAGVLDMTHIGLVRESETIEEVAARRLKTFDRHEAVPHEEMKRKFSKGD